MELLENLMKQLSEARLEVSRKVPLDGNCFYHVIGRNIGLTHQEVRRRAVKFLSRNLQDENWWKGVVGETEREARYFLREQKIEGVWADHVMALGVARCFELEISIFGARGETVLNGEGEDLRRKVNVGFVDDVHYFEVKPRGGIAEVGMEDREEEEEGQEEQIPHLDVTDGNVGVFNLGVEGLTDEMVKVMDLGSKFVPLQRVNLSKTFADLERLRNHLLWKVFWSMRGGDDLNEEGLGEGMEGGVAEVRNQDIERRIKSRERKFGCKTNAAPRQGLIPSRLENAVDGYVEAVKEDIVKGLKKKPEDNLDETMRKALSDIQEKVRKGEWAVRPADKGGGLTVEKKSSLVEDGRNELRKADTYQDLEGSHVKRTAERVKVKLKDMENRGIISQKLYFGLQNRHPTAGTLKLNRKLHKEKNENGRYPWRAYVSGIGTATEGVAGLVEWELTEGVKAQPSFVEDSADFIRKLRGWRPLEEDEFMFTVDVVNMYPSIPRVQGREAMRKNLERRLDKSIPTKDLLELADLVLENNEIEFEGQKAIQIDGTAIGSKLGKNYSCTFMGEWEKKTQAKSAASIGKKPIQWVRFVDDGFGVWKGPEEDFLKFMQICNEEDPRIRITFKVCREEAVFLDVMVIRQQGGRLGTTLYTKPTDRQRYLHVRSDHPSHTKRGIAKGQLKRLKRICSKEADFHERAEQLK